MANTKDDITIHDYIIIGGGTSGTVAARRLAEGKDHYNVCLIEAGPRFVLLYTVLLFGSSHSL
jgi:choline dehydrogenase-like flavoprotein